MIQKLLRITKIGIWKWELLIGKISRDPATGQSNYSYDLATDRVEWDSKNFVVLLYEEDEQVKMALVPRKGVV